MTPYIAILKDSLREAVASRVLLITLIGIVVVLTLLAPFGLRYDIATEVRRSEVTQPDRLVRALLAAENERGTATAHLWNLLSADEQSKMREMLDTDAPTQRRRGPASNPLKRELVRQLNRLLNDDAFSDSPTWEDVRRTEELESLLQQDDLNDVQQQRRNLLLLSAAFPYSIRLSNDHAISLTYGTLLVQGPFQLTPEEFEPVFDWALQTVIAIFLGFFGVFGSLLVTAGIIPRTFEPGEISLLLSKPVRRSALFVTRYFGGCMFTLLYATVLVVGIWLLLGFRLGFWRHQILWCIPIYLLLFAIYYSVSAVAGAVWRNSIVALSLVLVFWLSVTVVGTVEQTLRENLIRERGIREVIPAGDEVLTVDGEKKVYRWDQDQKRWMEVFQEPPGQMDRFARFFLASGIRFAPVYDAPRDRILALQQKQARFGGLGSSELVAGRLENDWERESLGQVPEFVSTILLTADGRVLLPGRTAVYEYRPDQTLPVASGLLRNLTGRLFGGAERGFRKVALRNFPELQQPYSSTVSPDGTHLFYFSNGSLHRLRATEDDFVHERSRDFGNDVSGVIAAGSQHLLLGTSDGRLIVMDTDTLETVAEERLPEGVLPRICVAGPKGELLAAVTHEQTVWVYRPSTESIQRWTGSVAEPVSALSFAQDGDVLVADGRLKVSRYEDLDQSAPIQAWAEPEGFGYRFYDLLILPAYRVLPKPAELDQFVAWVMSGQRTTLARQQGGPPLLMDEQSLEQQRETFQPQKVILSNVSFIAVMLVLGCLYLARTDF